MDFKDIMSISGLPGLFSLVASKANGIVVKSMEDGKTQFVSSRIHGISSLDNISVYLAGDETISLRNVLAEMKKQETAIPLPDAKSDASALKAYFKKMVPDYDEEKGQYFDKKGEQWFLYGLMFDITEQKEQENNLLQSQMRFKSVFENNNLPIVIADVDGNIIELNEAFCHLTGYTMQEAIKIKVFEYIHPDSPRTTTEDGNAFVSGKVKALSNLNRIIQTKNGEKRYLNVNLSGIYNEHNKLLYNVSIIEDVTEKRIIAQALEQSVAMQRALLNAIPDLVFHVHRDGTYLNAFIPQTMELETRRRKEDIIGKNILELIPNPTGQNLYNFLLSALDSKQVETYEYSAIVNNEELFY